MADADPTLELSGLFAPVGARPARQTAGERTTADDEAVPARGALLEVREVKAWTEPWEEHAFETNDSDSKGRLEAKYVGPPGAMILDDDDDRPADDPVFEGQIVAFSWFSEPPRPQWVAVARSEHGKEVKYTVGTLSRYMEAAREVQPRGISLIRASTHGFSISVDPDEEPGTEDAADADADYESGADSDSDVKATGAKRATMPPPSPARNQAPKRRR